MPIPMLSSTSAMRARATEDLYKAIRLASMGYARHPGNAVKVAQAKDYLAGYLLNQLFASPPYIAAISAATGQTSWAVANMIVTRDAAWHAAGGIGPQMEAVLELGLKNINAAATVDAVQAAGVAAIAAISG